MSPFENATGFRTITFIGSSQPGHITTGIFVFSVPNMALSPNQTIPMAKCVCSVAAAAYQQAPP
jgi:hypothetical protein